MDYRHIRIPSSNPAIIVVLLILLGTLIYSNSFQGEFCSDDNFVIVENPSLRDAGRIADIWHSFNTRFLTGLSFRFNYWAGGLDPFGYHIVNLAWHILAALGVYFFVRLTFLTPKLEPNPLTKKASGVALLASLIFLCHPVQTETVAYITQRSTSIATVFYLGTLLGYIQARLGNRPLFYLPAILCMALGSFSKEMMVTVPLTLTVYEIFFFQNRKSDLWPRMKILGLFYLLAGLTPLALLQEKDSSLLDLRFQMAQPFSWDYFFTEINVLRTYLRMLFLPFGLNHGYAYPIARGLSQIPTILSLILLLSLLGLAIVRAPKMRLVSFSIIWFFITTAVEAIHVCFVHGGVIYDHWLYLPMVGFSLFSAVALFSLLKNERQLAVVNVVLILTLSSLTFRHNFLWQTCRGLWEEVVKKFPQDALSHVNLGVAYSRENNVREAITHFHKAIDLNEITDIARLAQLYVNLGAAYGKVQDYDREIEWSQKAIVLDPANALAYTNIGMAYMMKENYDEALKYSERAVELNPSSSLVHNNLGALYARKKNFPKALEFFQNAVLLNPQDEMAARNIQFIMQQLR